MTQIIVRLQDFHSNVMPSGLSDFLSAGQWTAMRGAILQAESNAQSMTCMAEWGVCCCFLCPCVFLCHVCIYNGIFEGGFRQESVNINRTLFNGALVVTCVKMDMYIDTAQLQRIASAGYPQPVLSVQQSGMIPMQIQGTVLQQTYPVQQQYSAVPQAQQPPSQSPAPQPQPQFQDQLTTLSNQTHAFFTAVQQTAAPLQQQPTQATVTAEPTVAIAVVMSVEDVGKPLPDDDSGRNQVVLQPYQSNRGNM